MATAAAGHHYLVLPLLIIVVGVVLGIGAADLREQKQKEPRPIGRPQCRSFVGGRCYKAGQIPSETICKPQGRPWCKGKNLYCCYPDEEITKKGCVLWGIVWPHEAYLTETCFELQCKDGTWEYEGNFDNKCGNCTFGGEPLIYTWDPVLGNSDYFTFDTGEFVMAQRYFEVPSEFGVTSHFIFNYTDCNTGDGPWCVDGATYFEPGINITIVIPPVTAILSELKVFVNGQNRTIGNAVHNFYGTDGAVLVFKHNHIGVKENVNCIGILGSKGFSVAVCERSSYPWAYILAMPSLQSTPSQLYGLCNTWTGSPANTYTRQDGTQTTNRDFVETWRFPDN